MLALEDSQLRASLHRLHGFHLPPANVDLLFHQPRQAITAPGVPEDCLQGSLLGQGPVGQGSQGLTSAGLTLSSHTLEQKWGREGDVAMLSMNWTFLLPVLVCTIPPLHSLRDAPSAFGCPDSFFHPVLTLFSLIQHLPRWLSTPDSTSTKHTYSQVTAATCCTWISTTYSHTSSILSMAKLHPLFQGPIAISKPVIE